MLANTLLFTVCFLSLSVIAQDDPGYNQPGQFLGRLEYYTSDDKLYDEDSKGFRGYLEFSGLGEETNSESATTYLPIELVINGEGEVQYMSLFYMRGNFANRNTNKAIKGLIGKFLGVAYKRSHEIEADGAPMFETKRLIMAEFEFQEKKSPLGAGFYFTKGGDIAFDIFRVGKNALDQESDPKISYSGVNANGNIGLGMNLGTTSSVELGAEAIIDYPRFLGGDALSSENKWGTYVKLNIGNKLTLKAGNRTYYTTRKIHDSFYLPHDANYIYPDPVSQARCHKEYGGHLDYKTKEWGHAVCSSHHQFNEYFLSAEYLF